jgi:hypothetical protein
VNIPLTNGLGEADDGEGELHEPEWLSMRRMFSGVPRELRRRRLVIVLQAFADDSGSEAGSEAYALTGYMLPTFLWDEFSPKWNEACLAPRPIQYYRTNEAMGFKRQFAGWNLEQRDDKLRLLSRVISDASPIEIGARLRRSDYEGVFCRVRGFPETVTTEPYYILATYLCADCEGLARHFQSRTGLTVDKIDFFFDKQGGVGLEFKTYFESIAKAIPRLAACV